MPHFFSVDSRPEAGNILRRAVGPPLLLAVAALAAGLLPGRAVAQFVTAPAQACAGAAFAVTVQPTIAGQNTTAQAIPDNSVVGLSSAIALSGAAGLAGGTLQVTNSSLTLGGGFTQTGGTLALGGTTAQGIAGVSPCYYRLRLVDVDGTFSYSPVRVVAFDGTLALTLAPNPAAGATLLRGAAPGAPVQVLDVRSRVVLRAVADAQGAAGLALPAGRAAGVYVVRSGGRAVRLLVE